MSLLPLQMRNLVGLWLEVKSLWTGLSLLGRHKPVCFFCLYF